MKNIWVLAQASGKEGASDIVSTPAGRQQTETMTKSQADPNSAPQPRPRSFNPGQFILLGLMVVVFYVLIFRGPRKKQQQHKKMVQSLQKNDKVQTIGGIIGTIVDIRDDEVTLKVDESNNTKIKVVPSAIGRNVSRVKE